MAQRYYRTVTVTNTLSSLANYQVLITLDTAAIISAGHMRSDCGDIRVYASNGTTALPFYIEPLTINTSATRIWVKVTSLPNGSSALYLYYGDPTLLSISSGSATFIFFEDFSGSLATQWTIVSGTVTIVSGPACQIAASSGGSAQITSKNAITITNTILEFDERPTGSSDGWIGRAGGYFTNGSNKFGVEWDVPNTNMLECDKNTSVTTISDTLGAPPALNAWNSYRYSNYPTGATSYDVTNSIQVSNAVSDVVSTGYLNFISRYGDTNQVRYIKVRQYVATEPTAAVGNEATIGIISISCGGYHTFALMGAGMLQAAGLNGNGQLGLGDTNNRSNFTTLSGVFNITAVAAGGYHTLALDASGNVWATGMNNHGQLGQDNTTELHTFTKISALSNIIGIAAGEYHSIALDQAGGVWVWGYDNCGQLGDSGSTDRTTPYKVM